MPPLNVRSNLLQACSGNESRVDKSSVPPESLDQNRSCVWPVLRLKANCQPLFVPSAQFISPLQPSVNAFGNSQNERLNDPPVGGSTSAESFRIRIVLLLKLTPEPFLPATHAVSFDKLA